MRILFELSGEHSALSVAEIKACMKAYMPHFEEKERNRIFVVDADVCDRKIQRMAKRLSLCYTLNEVIASGKKEEILDALHHFPLTQKKFKIEGKKFKKGESISLLKKEFGEVLTCNKAAKVDLQNPDVIFRIFIGDKIFFAGRLHVLKERVLRKGNRNIAPFPPLFHCIQNLREPLSTSQGLKKGNICLIHSVGQEEF